MPLRKASRGRRPGEPQTKVAILRAARKTFAERGFAGSTMRGIGIEAGVDPALVHHYFGSKRALFAAALDDGGEPEEAFRTSSAQDPKLGERLVESFVRRWDRDGEASPLATMLRSAGSDAAAERLLSDLIARSAATIATTAVHQTTAMPRLRMALVTAQLMGLAWMRYVLRREPLASASPQIIARTFGPGIAATLAGARAESSIAGSRK